MKHFLFMVDLDGTLVRKDQTTLPDSVCEILAPVAKARRLIINSARHPLGVKYALGSALPFVPTIALNGAALYMEDWENPSECHPFPTPVVDSVIRASHAHNVALSIYTATTWWVTRFDAAVRHEGHVTGMFPEKLTVPPPSKVLKMTAMGPETCLDELLKNLTESGLVSSARSNHGYCEINPLGRSKINLIPALLQNLGFSRDTVDLHFIGDSHNDIECAAFSDSAYTFSSAPSTLRKLAKKAFKVESDHQLISALRAILQQWKE